MLVSCTGNESDTEKDSGAESQSVSASDRENNDASGGVGNDGSDEDGYTKYY